MQIFRNRKRTNTYNFFTVQSTGLLLPKDFLDVKRFVFTIGKWNIFQIFYILNIHNNFFINSLNFTEQGRRQVLACMSSLVRTDAKEMLYEFIVFTSGVSTAQVDIERPRLSLLSIAWGKRRSWSCRREKELELEYSSGKADKAAGSDACRWWWHLVKPIRLPDPMPEAGSQL